MSQFDLSSFDAAIDSIESPAERVKRVVRAIAATELHDVPEAIAESLLSAATTPLARGVQEAIEGGHLDQIGALLTQFSIDLRASVTHERQHGALKPPTNGVEERLESLRAHGWGSIEVQQLRAMLKPEEALVAIDFFGLQTNQRTITRDQVREFGRPVTWTNTQSWFRQFKSDSEVENLRREAEQRERNERAPWADNYNRDIPRNRVISD